MTDLVFKSAYLFSMNPEKLCLFKFNNHNMFEIRSQLTIKKLERRHCLDS